MSGYDIIILPGQSNTVGNGMPPFTDSSNAMDSRIFQVGRRSPDDMTIIPAAEPLHFWNKAANRIDIGYGMSLARYYAFMFLQPGRNVLLVPAAEGSTSILQWLQLISGTGDPLYTDMLTRVALGMSQSGSKIIGWFEHQGEEDALIAANPADPNYALMSNAAAYMTRKLQYIDKVRVDFGYFPMFFGLFADAWTIGNATRLAFQTAIRSAAAQRQGCYVIDGSGLASEDSMAVHYNGASQQILALRHFDAYCAMLTPRRVITGISP